jgi:FtsZ-binding cell division protein ZapB
MDRIDLLEAKVKQMIDLVQSLREENRVLTDRLAAAEARERDMAEQRQAIDRERDTVRDRIEHLLGELAGMERPPAADTDEGNGAGEGREAAAGAHRADNPVLPGL